MTKQLIINQDDTFVIISQDIKEWKGREYQDLVIHDHIHDCPVSVRIVADDSQLAKEYGGTHELIFTMEETEDGKVEVPRNTPEWRLCDYLFQKHWMHKFVTIATTHA